MSSSKTSLNGTDAEMDLERQKVDLALTYSPFLKRIVQRHPDVLTAPPGNYGRHLRTLLSLSPSSKGKFMKGLREIRHTEMAKIAIKDLTGHWDTISVMNQLSSLVEALLDAAIEFSAKHLGLSHEGFVVLGMGKLGGRELNFSSDIDLVFAYQGGHTKQVEMERLAREIIQVIGAITEDGICFRVDTRLRPFGDSGPICMSFEQMEDYYEIHGREWERYALVKARPVAGDKRAGHSLLRRLRPFIYRKYLDFGAIETLRDMKELIEAEGQKKASKGNIKLGAGGIREVEFIVQAFQLIYGGQRPNLITTSTLHALEALGAEGIMAKERVERLKNAYLFLRKLENTIQEREDRQVHSLPADEAILTLIAQIMGFDSKAALLTGLNEHMSRVRHYLEALFSPKGIRHATGKSQDLHTSIWHLVLDEEDALSHLAKLGFKRPKAILDKIKHFKNSLSYKAMGQRSKAFLDRIVPNVLDASSRTNAPDTAFFKTFDVINAIGKRGFYLALLAEKREVLKNLVEFSERAPWISHYIANHPGVIDRLITIEAVRHVPSREDINQALKIAIQHVEPGDQEAFLDALRHFKHSYTFELAYLFLEKKRPIDEIVKSYTYLAESCLDIVLNEAWNALKGRYGVKRSVHDFLILGYGKLGSKELTFASDLDLVFLYQRKELPLFFTRVCQRVIHSLSTLTPAGRLFKVDMRLRPDGDQGVLISSLDSYKEYQLNQAWTWEHQALVRARGVTGDPGLMERFSAIRREVLKRPRDRERLLRDFSTMRNKMLEKAPKPPKSSFFHVKHHLGGLTDIEFLVQFHLLINASKFTSLLDETSTIGLLGRLGELDVISLPHAKRLQDIYRSYLVVVQENHLKGQEPWVEEKGEFSEAREFVRHMIPY